MIYLYVKAIHLVAVVTFITGILATALMLRIAILNPQGADMRRLGEFMLRWSEFVTTPALAVVWIAGFTMTFGGGWDGSPWLLLKMVPAIFLSGLHFIEGMTLKNLLRGEECVFRHFRFLAPAILVAFCVVAWLVVVKPF